jgi:hypothetical protein
LGGIGKMSNKYRYSFDCFARIAVRRYGDTVISLRKNLGFM